MVPFWGRCTTHFSRDFGGDWDVHWREDSGDPCNFPRISSLFSFWWGRPFVFHQPGKQDRYIYIYINIYIYIYIHIYIYIYIYLLGSDFSSPGEEEVSIFQAPRSTLAGAVFGGPRKSFSAMAEGARKARGSWEVL